ncbi:hypothetical protein [Shimia sp. SDUM112013]|uniref:hypothetical protein n=1 Tax=Shimia sp. SDUM112013 TaxID=3136160 RepID=UPI0032ED19CA
MLFKTFLGAIGALGVSLAALPFPSVNDTMPGNRMPDQRDLISLGTFSLASARVDELLDAQVVTTSRQPVGCIGSLDMDGNGAVNGAVVWLPPQTMLTQARPVHLPAAVLTVAAPPDEDLILVSAINEDALHRLPTYPAGTQQVTDCTGFFAWF